MSYIRCEDWNVWRECIPVVFVNRIPTAHDQHNITIIHLTLLFLFDGFNLSSIYLNSIVHL